MSVEEKNYREPLEKAGPHFGAFIEVTHDGLAAVDRMGMIRYVSPAAQRMLGGEPEDLIGTHISDRIHPDDLPYIMKRLALEVPDDIGKPIVYRARHKDGRWRWLEAITPRIDRGQVSDHYIFFIRDITRLRRLEQQYLMTERVAGCGVWRVELDDPYPYLSPGMLCLFGYDPETPVKGPKYWPLRMVHPADVGKVLKTLRSVLQKPRLFSFCCRVRRKSYATRVIKTTGYVETDAEGAGAAIIGISRDITPIRRAESKLRESERKYRLLTERSSDIIAQLSPDGTIEFISPAVQRIHGEKPGNLVGRNFRALLHGADHKTFDHFLLQLRQGNEDTLSTVRLDRNIDGKRWLELSGRTLANSNEVIKGFVCTARDITERKLIELKLRQTRQQAEQASASKSEFLRHVSHELRTPLNAIMGFSELISEQAFGDIGDERYREYARIIYESGGMLKTLINDLLDLSKIEAGKYGIQVEPLELKDIVPTCIQQIMPEAMKKGITISDHMSDSEFDFQADRQALMQILINLLSNAVKFTPAGGRVDLDARETGGWLWLNVHDTGVGIREEDLERIVLAFEQVTDESETSRSGTGLGLALAKSLTELHGGNLLIESEPGVGTTVSVVLPIGEAGKAVA